MKRAGILFSLMIFAAGIFSAAANNVIEFKNDLNIAVDIIKTHKILQRPDHDPTKSQVNGSLEAEEPIPVGVETQEVKQLSVYPNPCVNSIKVSGVEPGDKLAVYNNVGQIVRTQIAQSKEETIDLSNVAPGYYHLAIVNSLQTEQINFMK